MFSTSNSNSVPHSAVVVGDDNSEDNPQVAWWCKIAVKAAAGVAGGVCIGMGVWRCLTVSPFCLAAGIIEILLGLLVLVFEIPICCQYFKITQPISAFAERRTFFQKAFLFAGPAILPVAMCFSLSTVIGCGLVFAVGVLYGLMALGKKADRETMLARAGEGDKVSIVPNIVVEHPK